MSSDPVQSPFPMPATTAQTESKQLHIPGMPSIGLCSCGTQLGARDKVASGIGRVALWLWWIAERLSCPTMREEVFSWLGRALALRERAEARGLCLPCLLRRPVLDAGLAELGVIWRTIETEPTEGLCYPHSLLGASRLASRIEEALPAEQALAAELRGAAIELAAAAESSAARTRTGQEGSERGSES